MYDVSDDSRLLTNSGVSGVTGVFKFFFFAYVVGARQRVKVWKIPECFIYLLCIYISSQSI